MVVRRVSLPKGLNILRLKADRFEGTRRSPAEFRAGGGIHRAVTSASAIPGINSPRTTVAGALHQKRTSGAGTAPTGEELTHLAGLERVPCARVPDKVRVASQTRTGPCESVGSTASLPCRSRGLGSNGTVNRLKASRATTHQERSVPSREALDSEKQLSRSASRAISLNSSSMDSSRASSGRYGIFRAYWPDGRSLAAYSLSR